MTKNSYKNRMNNLLKNYNNEIFELLLENISEDYDIDLEELKLKYLKPLKINKQIKERKKTKSCYSFFLSDQEIKSYLKEKCDNPTFSVLSKEYSKLWKAMSDKDKEKYRNMAKEFNNKNN